jgi:superfamily I DNA and/or RNA helicase
MVSLFENSLRIAWIEHLETKHPLLRAVSTLKLEQMERELQESILHKMQISRDITLLKAREKTYQDLEHNRLGNLVTYRDLKHQTGKKRSIWQIRKLFTAYADEIFKLIPCWMASPESVSAIFQMEEIFDLVIFDEASQCFAERGIPAIFRASQIVVTGDDKQLPPSDLYRVRFEEETEDTPELEVDSLLDLAVHYFPQIQLQGHYRSQSLELIDFSNLHFYKHTLQLLPDRQQINKQEPAIKYVKVEGIWQDNTNPVEAAAVVALVTTLTAQWPDKQIGVVTFNFKQQNLIQDLLEEYSIGNVKVLPATLFVKNIENVQGDERDIIIFSVGYAPDAKGRMAMQFGSLNMQGGENRLNVAITRAREQIYIISSIMPPQLKTEDTLHKGPKLLKEYLTYALLVSGGEYRPAPKKIKGFETSRLLKDKLVTWSSHLAKELPFADLTLREGKEYQSLLLTDDDLYHQSLSAKDAHAYTPFLLKKKNWPFIRIYSREYWKDKLKVQEKMYRIKG